LNILTRWIISIVAVWLTVQLGRALGLGLSWNGFIAAALFVAVLAFVNAVIRPIVKLFTLPLNCLTFGLFALVINAFLFWLTASVTGGLAVHGVMAALFGSIVLSLLSGLINGFVNKKSKKE
jgi:putative membrane protein